MVLLQSRYEYVTLSKVFNLTEPQPPISHFPFEENDTCTLIFIHIHIHSYSLLTRGMKWLDKLLDKRRYRYLRRVTFRVTWLMIDSQNSLHFIPSWVEWSTEMALPTNGLWGSSPSYLCSTGKTFSSMVKGQHFNIWSLNQVWHAQSGFYQCSKFT